MNGPEGGPTKHEKEKTHTTGPGPFCPKIEHKMSKRTGVFRYFVLTRSLDGAGWGEYMYTLFVIHRKLPGKMAIISNGNFDLKPLANSEVVPHLLPGCI